VFPADAILVAIAAFLGTIARGLVSAYCHGPTGGPQGGTAASYCSTIHHGWSWGAFIAAALAVVAVLRLLSGRWRCRRPVTFGLLVTALVANTAIVGSLPGYTT
jgi:hypothetical protein